MTIPPCQINLEREPVTTVQSVTKATFSYSDDLTWNGAARVVSVSMLPELKTDLKEVFRAPARVHA